MRIFWMAGLGLMPCLLIALVLGTVGRQPTRADETPAKVEPPAPKAPAAVSPMADPTTAATTPAVEQAKIGRPVRIVSLSFLRKSADEVAQVVDAEGAKGADLIILPETWTGKDPVPVDGPLMKRFAALAKKHNTYVVNSVYRKTGGKPRNSAVLIDRQGHIAGIYDKVFPYWAEFDAISDLDVGREAPVIDTDFGRIGFAICFDVNFPEVWSRLADNGAELVVWPSAYKAGRALQAHAINHHYYIVTSTWRAQSLVYDITGDKLVDSQAANVDALHVTRVTLDLDRRVYHTNFNEDKVRRLLKDNSDDVVMEVSLEQEQWFVLKAKRPGVNVKSLADAYGLEEHRDYIVRSRKEMDRRRDERFVERVMQHAPDAAIWRSAAAKARQASSNAAPAGVQ